MAYNRVCRCETYALLGGNLEYIFWRQLKNYVVFVIFIVGIANKSLLLFILAGVPSYVTFIRVAGLLIAHFPIIN